MDHADAPASWWRVIRFLSPSLCSLRLTRAMLPRKRDASPVWLDKIGLTPASGRHIVAHPMSP
jgi:hypothetical protein